MQLLIDFGNTRIKWGLLEAGELRYGGEAVYREQDMHTVFGEWWADLPVPSGILCASVASPAYTDRLDSWCRQQWQRPATFVQAVARQLGVRNAYAEPHTLGSDRWVALLAAHRLTSHHAGIIDCGSAITVDLLHADGAHQGGYIVPGLWMMQQCLLEHAQRIDIPPALSGQLTPGDSSAACIQHGALRSVTGFLERVMIEQQQQHDNRLEWLLTGGDAPHIQPHLRQACHLVPDLVLQGLAYVAQGNE